MRRIIPDDCAYRACTARVHNRTPGPWRHERRSVALHHPLSSTVSTRPDNCGTPDERGPCPQCRATRYHLKTGVVTDTGQGRISPDIHRIRAAVISASDRLDRLLRPLAPSTRAEFAAGRAMSRMGAVFPSTNAAWSRARYGSTDRWRDSTGWRDPPATYGIRRRPYRLISVP
jgi:hypothetical protein